MKEMVLDLLKNRLEGRIVKSLSGFYYVAVPAPINQVIECRACGAFRQQQIKPCVGDIAIIEMTDNNKGYVLQLGTRRNSLVRPPLANIDQLVLVTSIADPPPNLFVLDKMIALAEFQKIEPLIVVTKSDIGDTKEFANIYKNAGFSVNIVCSINGAGVEEIKEILKGKISAFCGNSGAGKSSLLNAIDKNLSIDTAATSHKLGRGRHTTRQVELYELPNGGYVADTPGFSAVDLEKFQVIRKEELAGCFREFEPFEQKCRYTGCSHTKEAGCAVLEALNDGIISQSRHQSYTALYELARNIKDWECK